MGTEGASAQSSARLVHVVQVGMAEPSTTLLKTKPHVWLTHLRPGDGRNFKQSNVSGFVSPESLQSLLRPGPSSKLELLLVVVFPTY